jgi:radical SAM superfamily enzyme YgiQ (UPF0313 family)
MTSPVAHARRVALVNPGTRPEFAIQEPLHLGFLAAYLEAHGVAVRLVDELAGENVFAALTSWQPDLVGITATTPLAADAYRVAAWARQHGIPTVMGGVHASILPEECAQHVDAVVCGEGEEALLRLAQGDTPVNGIVKGTPIRDLDRIPPPARHLLDMAFYSRSRMRIPDSYLYFVPRTMRVAALLTSRGCPHDCLFCHNSWRDTPFRCNSAERVLDEIATVLRDYRVQALFFIEDDLFANMPRLRRICEGMLARGFRVIWGANARVSDVDAELLALAHAAGCRQITFGFESGSQRVLDVLRKGTTVEQNYRAVALCRAAGIIPQGTVMLGNPEETEEEVRATQRFIRESRLESVGVCLATPYPGTGLWQYCEERGRIPSGLQWADLLYQETPIAVTDAIAPARLRELYRETLALVEANRPLPRITPARLLRQALAAPGALGRRAVTLLRHPRLLLQALRRVRFQ